MILLQGGPFPTLSFDRLFTQESLRGEHLRDFLYEVPPGTNSFSRETFLIMAVKTGRDEGLFKSINRLSIAGGFFHSPSFFPHKCQNASVEHRVPLVE